MDKERNQDLNPTTDGIEEKVRQMLDPSVPDVPDLGAKDDNQKPEKIVTIIPVADMTSTPEGVNSVQSAPELPIPQPLKQSGEANDDLSAPSANADKSKKVIVPIVDHDDATDDLLPVDATNTSETLPATASPVTEVTIASNNETSSEVAEKLDQAIAGLGAGETTTPEVEAEALPITEPAVMTDPATDKAVAAIVAAESDEILEIEDAVRDSDEPRETQKNHKARHSIGQVIVALLRKPAFRWACLTLLVAGIIAAAVVPSARYFVLNTAGVRVQSSILVLDESTQQPLKNVQVSLGASSGTTDEAGKVDLARVKLGPTKLVITKRAFADVKKNVIIGWGSNPLGEVSLTPTGTQYSFAVTDFLSGKPVNKVAASSNEADALSDEAGFIKLTIDRPDDETMQVSLSLNGYRTEQITIDPDIKDVTAVKLVPARQHAYVSKRTGKFDIYKAYADGKEEQLVLAGSGNEREDLVLALHSSENLAAFVSTRAGQKNSQGFELSNLILINIDTNQTTNVGASEQIKLVNWAGDRLIYVEVAAGGSANTPDRYRLMSYNYKDATTLELAKSNFFNDVLGIGNTVYYAPSSAFQTTGVNFYKVNTDGTNPETIYNQEVWNMFRVAYDTLALSVQQQWFEYRIGGGQPTKLNLAPPQQVSRVYSDNPNGKTSTWVDNRDGKGVLLAYDIAVKTEKVLHSQSGLTYPLYWLSESAVVYRIKNNQETADYALSIDGGEPIKIRDVTNTRGLSTWY